MAFHKQRKRKRYELLGPKNIYLLLACGAHFNEGECLDDGTSLFQIQRIVNKCKPHFHQEIRNWVQFKNYHKKGY